MAGKFGSLADFRNQENSENSVTRTPKDEGRDSPRPAKSHGQGPGRPTGKRSNPDYEQTTVLLKKKTKKAAVRMLEDAGKKADLSELLQTLLDQHVSAHT
jgi:hypothetical protein